MDQLAATGTAQRAQPRAVLPDTSGPGPLSDVIQLPTSTPPSCPYRTSGGAPQAQLPPGLAVQPRAQASAAITSKAITSNRRDHAS
jgi:hypothetical protein